MASPAPGLSALPATSSIMVATDGIKGNVTPKEKHTALSTFKYFVSTKDKSYGADVGQRINLLEVNIWDRTGPAAWAQTTFELLVEKDMCNVFGTLHGACAAYIVDPCSVSSLVALGNAIGVDGTGVSQSMNLIWHQPVRIGTKLKIVATSLFLHGRVRTARCELWDGDKLCVSAVHSTINPWQSKSKQPVKL